MQHNISQAAKLVGKSRATIYKHIKQGRLSAQSNHAGNKYITTDELLRCYGALKEVDTLLDNTVNVKSDQQLTVQELSTPNDSVNSSAVVDSLRDQIDLLKDQLTKAEGREQVLQERVLQLEYQPEAKQTKKGSLFKRFGQNIVDVLP